MMGAARYRLCDLSTILLPCIFLAGDFVLFLSLLFPYGVAKVISGARALVGSSVLNELGGA